MVGAFVHGSEPHHLADLALQLRQLRPAKHTHKQTWFRFRVCMLNICRIRQPALEV
jgi:hypothetical protein